VLNAVEAVEAILYLVRQNYDGDGTQLREQVPEKVEHVVVCFCCVKNANKIACYVDQNVNYDATEL
jgi:hypothetical protein